MAVAKHTDSKQNGGPHSQASNQNCCASCQMPIKDRFVFNLGVIEQNFHQDCVRCADCSSNLNDRCYFYDGKLYCRVDYWRRFGPKCSACQEPIKPTELVQRLKENLVYHLNCFVCQDCKRHLQAGEQLHLIDDKRLLCKRDYMNIAASASTASRTASNAAAGPNATNNNNNSLHTNNNQGTHGNQENDGALADNMSSASNASEVGGAPQMASLVNNNNISAVTQLAGDEQDELDDLDDRSSTADGDQSGLESMQYAGQYAPNPASGGNHLTPGGKGTEEMLKGAGLVDCGDDLVDANGKRRGPRTTIKPKQLDTLRRAFESAPKPSRAVREQLATETGLNMRVIQVWFQNRRSKERRMKNTNGSARRNFFRSSSRRLRVGPAGANAPTANGAAVLAGAVQQAAAAANAAANANASPVQQQSLIAGGRSGANKKLNQQQQRQQQQQLSPLNSADGQMGLASVATAVGGAQPGRQHNSPSEFGGSSSGGFTYFSDSSNQGDAFAINTSGHQQQQPAQQPQPVGAPQQQQQQYMTQNGLQQGETANLMALGSPSGGTQATSNHHQQHQAGAPQQQAAARSQQQQQQYAHQSMKNTPPPPPIYAGGPVAPQPPPPQQQQHLLMGAGHPNVGPHPPPLGHPHQHQQHQHHQQHQQQHQHHQQHLGPNQMMQPSSDPMNMGAILGGHPQGPTMVQW